METTLKMHFWPYLWSIIHLISKGNKFKSSGPKDVHCRRRPDWKRNGVRKSDSKNTHRRPQPTRYGLKETFGSENRTQKIPSVGHNPQVLDWKKLRSENRTQKISIVGHNQNVNKKTVLITKIKIRILGLKIERKSNW